MAQAIFEAEAREKTGTGPARALRRAEKVPAIIYGAGEKEVNIAVERRQLLKELNKGGFNSRVFEIKLGNETIRVLPREVQAHPVTDFPEHVDFMRVTKDDKVNVFIKVVFHGRERCQGLRRGGILNIVRHEIEFFCVADNIPEAIHANLEGLSIGDSLHINDVELPEGVTPVIGDRNFTIATIAGRAAKEEETEVTAGAEEASEGQGAEEAEGDSGGEASSE